MSGCPRQWPETGRGLDAWREPIETTIGPWLGSPNPDFLKIDLAPLSGDGQTRYKAVRHEMGIRIDIDYDADALPRPDSFETGVRLIEGAGADPPQVRCPHAGATYRRVADRRCVVCWFSDRMAFALWSIGAWR